MKYQTVSLDPMKRSYFDKIQAGVAFFFNVLVTYDSRLNLTILIPVREKDEEIGGVHEDQVASLEAWIRGYHSALVMKEREDKHL